MAHALYTRRPNLLFGCLARDYPSASTRRDGASPDFAIILLRPGAGALLRSRPNEHIHGRARRTAHGARA